MLLLITKLVISKLREITIGLNIAKVLKTMRSKKTKGVILNDLSMAYTKYSENDIFLQIDSIEEKEIKQMIAEFAIFANSFVGEYLKVNLNMGIFRTCPASEWLGNIIQRYYSGRNDYRNYYKRNKSRLFVK